MEKKVISFDEIKKEHDDIAIPQEFKYVDILKYINTIEYYLNYFYEIADKDEASRTFAADEQFKILVNVFEGFFNILFAHTDNFDIDNDDPTIIYEFLCELYKICYKLPDLDAFEAKTKILDFKNSPKSDNNQS